MKLPAIASLNPGVPVVVLVPPAVVLPSPLVVLVPPVVVPVPPVVVLVPPVVSTGPPVVLPAPPGGPGEPLPGPDDGPAVASGAGMVGASGLADLPVPPGPTLGPVVMPPLGADCVGAMI
jgi:hypothetical protein